MLPPAMALLLLVGQMAMAQVKHPVMDHSSLLKSNDPAGYKQRAAYLMGLSEEEMLALVPPQAGLYFVGCPACTGGRQEHQLVWDVKNPRQAKCKYCGHVYPSEKYPMDKVQRVTTPAGNVVECPYWENEKGYRYYFESYMNYNARGYMSGAAEQMAAVYHLTGEQEYARRCALILNRFAEVYGDYAYHFDFPFRQKEWYEGEVPPEKFRGGFRTARWHWWAYMDIPIDLVFAYDMIYESGELEKIAGAKERIENDFFIPATEQVMANKDGLHNMSPVAWRGMIAVARVLQKPKYMHEVIDRLQRFAALRFYADGVWKEGAPSYFQQVIGGMASVFQVSQGYSDPEAYKHPETGVRYDDLDLQSGLPVLARIHAAYANMRMPNGRLVPVHDTWPSTRRGPLKASKPVLLPHLGHVILGRGEGESQMQVHLTWSGGYGHTHYDGLSMIMFAAGEEMLSDVGYTHTKYAPWRVATVGHNTVVVDCENQYAGSNPPSDGSLLFFDAASPDVQVVRAGNANVYPDRVSRYERQLAMVGIDGTTAYVVDTFVVQGGTQHDYFIHGSADRPQSLTVVAADSAPIPTAPVETMLPEGAKWEAPTGENFIGRARDMGYAYGFLWDNAVATPESGVKCATFAYDELPLAPHVHLLTQAGDELYTGTNPQVRPAKEEDDELDKYKRPYVMIRRAGGDEPNTFISVIEPGVGDKKLTSVQVLASTGEGTALLITTAEFVDIIGLYGNDLTGTYAGAEFAMNGPLSQLRIGNDGEVIAAYTAGTLSYGSLSLQPQPTQEAKLLEVERFDAHGALIIDADWGELGPPAGTVLILDHGDGFTRGYTVEAVEKADAGTRIVVTDEPGFEYDAAAATASYVFFPLQKHTGEHKLIWRPGVSYRRHD